MICFFLIDEAGRRYVRLRTSSRSVQGSRGDHFKDLGDHYRDLGEIIAGISGDHLKDVGGSVQGSRGDHYRDLGDHRRDLGEIISRSVPNSSVTTDEDFNHRCCTLNIEHCRIV